MKKLLTTLSPGGNYTLHSHTQFCDGRFTMAEFAQAAVDEGMVCYGFSPHSPLPIQSPCNMLAENVPAYLAEVERLRNIYGDRIKLYASMEIDYLSESWGPSIPYFQSLGLDYSIGSIHFIPTQEGEMIDIDGSHERFAQSLKNYFHNDLDYVVETFFAQSMAMVSRGGFDIIGHLDKVADNASSVRHDIERTPRFKFLIEQLIDSIAANGEITVEVNTKAFAKSGRFFPDEKWWPLLRERHLPVVVNSDAHFKSLISASRHEAIKRLLKANII